MSYQSDKDKRQTEIIHGADISWVPQNMGQMHAHGQWDPPRRTPQPWQQSDDKPIPPVGDFSETGLTVSPIDWRSFFYLLIGMAVFSILILAGCGLLAWLLRRYVEAL